MSTSIAPPDTAARTFLAAAAKDALVVAVWFVVAGLLGALVWWQATSLPTVVRAGKGATLSPEELVKQVNIDAWFFVVAAVGGLVSGVALMAWRRRDPVLTVILVVLGGALASWLMVHVGQALGPDNEIAALRRLPDGAKVPMQLKLHAPGVAWVWSIAAALGAFLHVWILKSPDDHLSVPAQRESVAPDRRHAGGKQADQV